MKSTSRFKQLPIVEFTPSKQLLIPNDQLKDIPLDTDIEISLSTRTEQVVRFSNKERSFKRDMNDLVGVGVVVESNIKEEATTSAMNSFNSMTRCTQSSVESKSVANQTEMYQSSVFSGVCNQSEIYDAYSSAKESNSSSATTGNTLATTVSNILNIINQNIQSDIILDYAYSTQFIPLWRYSVDNCSINDIIFISDTVLVVGSRNRLSRISFESTVVKSVECDVGCLCYSGSTIRVGSLDGSVSEYDTELNVVSRKRRLHSDIVTGIDENRSCSLDGSVVVVDSTSSSTSSSSHSATTTTSSSITCFCGDYFGYDNGYINDTKVHESSVYSIRTSDNVVASCSSDWSVKIRSTTQQQQQTVTTLDLLCHVNDIYFCSPTTLAIVTSDGRLRLYDITSRKYVLDECISKSRLMRVVCRGGLIVVGDDEGSVMVFRR